MATFEKVDSFIFYLCRRLQVCTLHFVSAQLIDTTRDLSQALWNMVSSCTLSRFLFLVSCSVPPCNFQFLFRVHIAKLLRHLSTSTTNSTTFRTPLSHMLPTTLSNPSSTCVSVGSDTEYQRYLSGTPSEVTSVPSRPLSRSSTLSGISTTATLDGVEGKRTRGRLHDLIPTSDAAMDIGHSEPHAQPDDEVRQIEGHNSAQAARKAPTNNNDYSATTPTQSGSPDEHLQLDKGTTRPVTIEEKIELMEGGPQSDLPNESDFA